VIDDFRQRSCGTHEPRPGSHKGRPDGTLDRRCFLGSALGTSTAVVAAVASPLGAPEAQAYDPSGDESGARYRESDHVEAFYRTNGYETLKK
jgi:hypothetical protein